MNVEKHLSGLFEPVTATAYATVWLVPDEYPWALCRGAEPVVFLLDSTYRLQPKGSSTKLAASAST